MNDLQRYPLHSASTSTRSWELTLEALPQLDPSFDITHYIMLNDVCVGVIRRPHEQPDACWAEEHDGDVWNVLPHSFASPQDAAVVLVRMQIYGDGRQAFIRQRN